MLLLEDFDEDRPYVMYKGAHLVFTSTLPPAGSP